jgi:hypothetical protein
MSECELLYNAAPAAAAPLSNGSSSSSSQGAAAKEVPGEAAAAMDKQQQQQQQQQQQEQERWHEDTTLQVTTALPAGSGLCWVSIQTGRYTSNAMPFLVTDDAAVAEVRVDFSVDCIVNQGMPAISYATRCCAPIHRLHAMRV